MSEIAPPPLRPILPPAGGNASKAGLTRGKHGQRVRLTPSGNSLLRLEQVSAIRAPHARQNFA